MAMSSTAIVVKLMADRLELESEHGRRVMGVLLFQDLAVVPLLVLIPALGLAGKDWRSLGLAGFKAAVLLTAAGGRPARMRWWLTLVARRKSEELFMLNLLLVTLGLAWLTEHFGLAGAGRLRGRHAGGRDRIQAPGGDRHPALPRRAAGPVLHHHRHEAGLAPGAGQWPLVLMLTLAAGAAKFAGGRLARLRRAAGVALRTGLYLAQAGEFGFVLLTLGAGTSWSTRAG
jgi:CPA2 family monovalent cation:H+ antiporter-2